MSQLAVVSTSIGRRAQLIELSVERLIPLTHAVRLSYDMRLTGAMCSCAFPCALRDRRTLTCVLQRICAGFPDILSDLPL